MPDNSPESDAPAAADPSWFREPTPREHVIAGALFIGFGLFFGLLFIVLSGWWFRWFILLFAAISVLHGVWHAVESRAPNPKSEIQNPKSP